MRSLWLGRGGAVSAILLIAGFALIGAVLVDIVITTLTMRGAGPMASRVMSGLWRVALIGHRRWAGHRLLARAGLAVMLGIVVLWVAMLWGGWSLVFLSSTGWSDGAAIVNATTGAPAEGWTYVYFAGFNLFTLGLGDYRPVGVVWQILTAFCAANGLLSLTLSVTYLVPIVSAVAQKRTLAVAITGLGGTPVDILSHSWDGRGFNGLVQPIAQLSTQITAQAQQHLAYPALHYFHSTELDTALPPRLAALNETLLVLRYGVAPHVRPADVVLMQAETAMRIFVAALRSAHLGPAPQTPEPPDLAALRGRGIPTVATEEFEAHLAELKKHRRFLLGFVENDGWSWREVLEGGPTENEG